MRARRAWRERLKPYYAELGIDPAAPVPASNRAPFDDAFCDVVEELKPARGRASISACRTPALLKRVKAAGCLVIGSRHHGRAKRAGWKSTAATP